MHTKEEKHRIPYNNWANSHLSVAKYYGGCNINGIKYVLDYENCKTEIIDGEIKYFPDLIEFTKPVREKSIIHKSNKAMNLP